MKIKMRRHEKELSLEETKIIIEKGEYGVLSMVADNKPYAVPVNYVYFNNHIYIHCAMEGYKITVLNRNNNAMFTVVGDTEILPKKFTTKYESACISGITEPVGEDEKYKVLVKFIEKYSSEFMEKGMKYVKNDMHKTQIIKIRIESITGKRGKG